MRFLFVLDPLEKLKPAKDSSIAMMRELQRRGCEVWACTPRSLSWEAEAVRAEAVRIELLPAQDGKASWFAVRESRPRTLDEFDAVLMRKDPPFDLEYLYATHLLEAALRAARPARVFNDPRALRDHNEKLAITEFPEFIAPTLVTADPDRIRRFRVEQGAIVVKPLDGMGGAGVFRIGDGDPNTNAIIETVTEMGVRTIMAQRFLPEIAQGDKRVLLVGGVPAPFALARIPQPGETRGNLAAGGTGRAQPLSARDRQIAERIGPILAGRGLLLVGLDVIGDHVTEINVTSPTCFVEIEDQTGFSVASMWADELERRVGTPPSPSPAASRRA